MSERDPPGRLGRSTLRGKKKPSGKLRERRGETAGQPPAAEATAGTQREAGGARGSGGLQRRQQPRDLRPSGSEEGVGAAIQMPRVQDEGRSWKKKEGGTRHKQITWRNLTRKEKRRVKLQETRVCQRYFSSKPRTCLQTEGSGQRKQRGA